MRHKGLILVDQGATVGSHPFGRCPTTLQPVANAALLGHVLDALHAAQVTESVVVAPGALYEDVRACLANDGPAGHRLSYVVHEDADDLPEALVSAADQLADAPSILHVADGLLWQPLGNVLERALTSSAELTLLIHPGARPEERLTGETTRLLRIAEFSPAKTALGISGIYLLGPGALRRAGRERWLTGGHLDLCAVADGFEVSGGGVDVQMVAGWRRYSGKLTDLLELNRVVLDSLSTDWEAPEEADNQIEGRVRIHATADVKSSTIVGPAIIGAGAIIADSYLGPYTSVGAQAHIEGAEIERSIISAGASITHVGGRLVSSVVGVNARIFRDFSLPRAIRLLVGDDVEVALS